MYIEHKKTERVITAHQKASPNAPLAVELFAGVGGFSLGMKAAGIDVALAVEKDEQTLATYSQNFPETSVLFSPLLPTTASHAVTVREAIGDLTFLSEEAFPQLLDTDELQLDLKQPTLEAQPSEYVLKLEQVFPSPPTTNPHLLTGCCLTRHTPSVVERFKATASGTTEPESRLYRLKWDGVARTLRAGTGSDKGRHTAARPIHPTHARVLTVRSCSSPVLFPGLVPLSSEDLAGHETSWECRATAIDAGGGGSHLSMFGTNRGCNSNGDSDFNWRDC